MKLPVSTRFRWIPVALGLVLLVSAGFKGHETATEPHLEKDFWTSRIWLIGVVEFEWVLGLWLLAGYAAWQARLMALTGFSVFSFIALFHALNGDASCGCFGKVSVNPWYTLGFDLVSVTGLIWWRPRAVRRVPCRQLFRGATVVFVFLVVGVPAAIYMAAFQPAEITADTDAGKNRIVLVDPNRWTGRPLPIRNYIDIGDELMAGRWVVLLYRHDCSVCAEHLPRYGIMAGKPGMPRIAFIEVPPYGTATFLMNSSATPTRFGVLYPVKNWIVTTPTAFFLDDGVVQPSADGEKWLSVTNRAINRVLG